MPTISGQLSLPNGEPLNLRFEALGISTGVMAGMLYTTQTDTSGNYTLTLPAGEYGFVYYSPSQGTSPLERVTVTDYDCSIEQLLDPDYIPGETETDLTAPTVYPPANIEIEFEYGAGGLSATDTTLATWLACAIAIDATDGVVTVSNDIADLGNTIAAGSHSVTFSASDAAGNTATASATLTAVEGAQVVVAESSVITEVLTFTEFEVA